MIEPSLAEALSLEVEIGVEADKFLKSDLGLVVIAKQRSEIENFHTELEDTKLTLEEMREIQLQITARRRALDWLVEIINQAKQAFEQSELIETED